MTYAKKLCILFVFLCAPAQAGMFAEHVGTHYIASWTHTVRNPTDAPAINPFITYDENYASFNSTVQGITAFDTALLQVWGGREQDAVFAFLDAVRADQGAGLRRLMRQKAGAVAGLQNVYWQIGNEINNGPKLSPAIHSWLGDGQPGGSNDLSIIPTWAEMVFAPAASGLLSGDPNARIVLGSVANAANTQAILFIDTLLDYQIAGTYAPNMAGKYVRDVIYGGSIHYSMGAGAWELPIDTFKSRGLSVWHTEEVGGRAASDGLCMAGFVGAMGRFFSYNADGKLFVWGAGIGANSCDEWMPLITNFIGASSLTQVSDVIVTGSGLESYVYQVGVTGKRAIYITAPGGGALTGVDGSGTMYVFRAAGVEQFPVSGYLNIPLDANAAVFIELESK